MSQADTLIPYHVPVPNRRPVSVLVLGIIGIVLASVVVLAYIVSGVMWVVMRGFASRTLTYGGPTGVEDAWEVVDAIASLFFYAVLFWVSIAAIRMRPWARLGMLRWAGAYLAWVAVATVV